MKKLKRNSVFIIVVSAIVLLFSVSFIRNFDNNDLNENDFYLFLEGETQEIEGKGTEVELIESKIVVDVKGAVNRPGVYEMQIGDRIINVIERANGFQEEADIDLINLAALVEDEMVIYVPYIDEEHDKSHLITMTMAKEEDGRININKATVEELQKIPGIGPAKANSIINNREENGNFQLIEDIIRVPGIGQKTLENMRDFIKVQ